MNTALTLFITTFATMIVIIDPPGNLPVFMSLTAPHTPKERRSVAWQSNVLALALLLIFGFFGFHIFGLMGITPEALQISGGLLLLLVALQLLTGKVSDPGEEGGTLNVAAVPLGTPLLAGPGAIVALMLQMDYAHGDLLNMTVVVLATIAVLIVSWLSMHFATSIMRVLGDSGVALLTKLSGMLLAAIAVQLIISGVLSIVRSLMAG